MDDLLVFGQKYLGESGTNRLPHASPFYPFTSNWVTQWLAKRTFSPLSFVGPAISRWKGHKALQMWVYVGSYLQVRTHFWEATPKKHINRINLEVERSKDHESMFQDVRCLGKIDTILMHFCFFLEFFEWWTSILSTDTKLLVLEVLDPWSYQGRPPMKRCQGPRHSLSPVGMRAFFFWNSFLIAPSWQFRGCSQNGGN